MKRSESPDKFHPPTLDLEEELDEQELFERAMEGVRPLPKQRKLIGPPVRRDKLAPLPDPSDLMTEAELIRFLRIPEVSKAKDHGSVIENLKRMRGLPCIHISRQPLYPRDAISRWIEQEIGNNLN